MKLFRSFSSVLFITCLASLPSLAFSQETMWYPFFTKLTGFVDGKGVTVIPLKYDNAGDFYEGLAWVTQNLKYGFIDGKGRMVIEPQYDFAGSFRNGTAVVEKDGKFGLVDKTGKEVLPLRYDECRGFEDGMAAVRSGALWGFVNDKGQETIAPQYDQVQDFSEGLAGARMREQWGYINKKGETVLKLQYSSVCPFSEGKAFVIADQNSLEYSLIDKMGRAVPSISMYIDNQPQLHNGYALFSRCSGAPVMCTHKVVDRKGQLVYEVGIQYKPPPSMNPDQTPITEVSIDELTPGGESPQTILDSLMPKYVKPAISLQKVRSAKKIRFFDQDGKIVPDQEYEGDSCGQVGANDFWIKKGGRITQVEKGRSAPLTIDASNLTLNFNFGNGLVSYLAKVKNPLLSTEDSEGEPETVTKTGFFDKTGKTVVGPEYDFLGAMSEGLAPFEVGNKVGYVRPDGTVAIPARFQESQMFEFSEGLAAFQADGKWGYINAKGETVVGPSYRDPSPFRDGFALVKTDDPMVDETIDTHGRIIGKFPNYYLNRFRDGLAAAYDKEKKRSGYIDKKGNWVIKPVFASALDFSEGLALVDVGGEGAEKCGFIDQKGAFRFPPFEGHCWTDGFKDSLAILSGRHGSFVIDKTGKKILESHNRSETIAFAQDGLITLWNQSGMMKYYDRKGKLLFANCYSEY